VVFITTYVYILTHDSYVTRNSSVIAIEYEYFYFISILLYNFNSIDEEIALYPIKSIEILDDYI